MKNRREEILDWAADLIETRGYAGFSYSDLSERLGIAKASIHHHFPKKSDLGLAIVERANAFLDERFAHARALVGACSWERLKSVFEPGCAKACEGKVCVVSSLLSDFDELPEELQTALRQVCETERDVVSALLEEGRSKGELAFTGDAKQQAAFVIEAVKGGLLYSRVWGPGAMDSNLETIRRNLG